MRHNIHLVILVGLTVIVIGLLPLAGCKKKAVPPPPKDAATAKEVPAPAAPFPGAAKAVGILADAAKGDVSAASAGKLGDLHVSGLVLLLLGVAAKFLFGSWRHAGAVVALGLGLSAGAVLLTDYPRVVLLVPLCGLALLIAFCVKKGIEWRTGYRAWTASADVIEKADTGPRSVGQRIKDKFVEAGVSGVLDKALKPLEALWDKEAR